jgi:hypothetical protein
VGECDNYSRRGETRCGLGFGVNVCRRVFLLRVRVMCVAVDERFEDSSCTSLDLALGPVSCVRLRCVCLRVVGVRFDARVETTVALHSLLDRTVL